MRSHAASPVTANALASSERPSVTTETTPGSPAGELSSASFTQRASSAHSSSAPASNAPSKVQLTRAESWKSPSTVPSRRGAAVCGSLPAGSRNRSVRGGAAIVSAPSKFQGAGAMSQLSGAGSGGAGTKAGTAGRSGEQTAGLQA